MDKLPGKATDYYERLTRQGRFIVALGEIGRRYATTVTEAAQRMGTEVAHHDVLRLGVIGMLKSVHEHTPIDTDQLEAMDDLSLAVAINEASNHMARTGKFNEGYRPGWLL